MNIRENIDRQYKQSIKNKNHNITNTLRLVKSAIKDKDIEVRAKANNEGISDQEILGLLQNLVKQRKDSIESFKDRKDLIAQELIEIDIINSFLPVQKNEKEIEDIVEELIKSNNLSTIKDMGRLIANIKSKFSGQVDMSIVGKIAKLKLGN